MSRGSLLLTRAAQQDSRERFARHGWQVEHIPCIRIVPPADRRPLQDALQHHADYDWVVFTSQNAVEQVRSQCSRLDGPKIAAIGPETARAVQRAFGRDADLVARSHRGEGLADELCRAVVPAARLLWLRAAEARAVLPEALRLLGHHLDVVTCYSVATADEHVASLARWLNGHQGERPAPIVVLASSKTAAAFFALAARAGWDPSSLSGNFRFACISPLTADAVRRAGATAHFVAEEHTMDGLLTLLRAEA